MSVHRARLLLRRFGHQFGLTPVRRFTVHPTQVRRRWEEADLHPFRSKPFGFRRRPAPRHRGCFGHEPSPICPVHRCHMKHLGKEFQPHHGRKVPTWGCPFPGCGQKVCKPLAL